MGSAVLAVVCVLLIMYIVPMPVYAAMQAMGLVQMPEGASPAQFMLSVLVMKIGVALAFVWLLRVAFSVFSEGWLLYAVIWWLMFALVEIGQAIGPNYSWGDAIGGIIAEAIYFPLSAWVAVKLLSRGKTT